VVIGKNQMVFDSVDATLAAWRQGDCVVEGEHWFAHRINTGLPVTEAGVAAAAEAQDMAEEETAGFTVVTQTCDLVRAFRERPFVEVCPLVEVDDTLMKQIRRGYRPSFAYLPGVEARCLVAHLDRVMTVEKPLVATWKRTPGCITETDARAFAQALVRKRSRFAFPDDFTVLARRLCDRLAGKHNKMTMEGRGLRALQEVRVHAEPSWSGSRVELSFWFIRRAGVAAFEGTEWSEHLRVWETLVAASGRFSSVRVRVVALNNLTVEEYLDSYPLDLDHLSVPTA